MLNLRYNTSFPENPNQKDSLRANNAGSRYVPVPQDNSTVMMSQNLDYKMFAMR